MALPVRKGKLANGDKRKIVAGRWLVHKGPLVICDSGFHASIRPIDALQYAPGNWVQRVECAEIGDCTGHTDKLVCVRRKRLWVADAESTLRGFARRCALDVLPLAGDFTGADIVREYLETGREDIRAAARDAAGDAAWAAAWDAAWAAAWAAAGASAWAAARDAAGDAAWAAAGAAARAKYDGWLSEMLLALDPR